MTPDAATQFMHYDYAETKDLAKAFLTLASGTLVFSLTFAEKVVGLRSAPKAAKYAMVGSWISLIFSIIVAGLAICFLAWAAGEAVYGSPFEANALRAYALLFIAGALFVAGLGGLIVSAVISMNLAGTPD